MDDGVQVMQASAGEGELGEFAAIQTAVRADDFRPEDAGYLGVDGLSRLHERAAELVGFDDFGAEFAETRGYSAFAAAEAAGEADAQHRLQALCVAYSSHSGGAHGVRHEHGDRERADAAGNWRVGSCDFIGFGMDVADDGRTALGECLSAFA